MLNEVASPSSIRGGIGEQVAYHIELVVAGKDLLAPDLAGLSVLLLDDLGVVLQDVGQALRSKNFFPEVIGFEPVGIRWITCPVVPAFVEGQEPRTLASQTGTEPYLVIIDREVGHAPPELE